MSTQKEFARKRFHNDALGTRLLDLRKRQTEWENAMWAGVLGSEFTDEDMNALGTPIGSCWHQRLRPCAEQQGGLRWLIQRGRMLSLAGQSPSREVESRVCDRSLVISSR